MKLQSVSWSRYTFLLLHGYYQLKMFRTLIGSYSLRLGLVRYPPSTSLLPFVFNFASLGAAPPHAHGRAKSHPALGVRQQGKVPLGKRRASHPEGHQLVRV